MFLHQHGSERVREWREEKFARVLLHSCRRVHSVIFGKPQCPENKSENRNPLSPLVKI